MESVIVYLSSVSGLTALAVALVVSPAAQAQSDPYHITANEKAACTADAVRLCSDAYPDEGKLLSCMAANRAALTGSCLAVFDAGMKKRRLVSR